MRNLTMALLRELSTEHFVSGAALAEKFSVSRSAVSDAFKEASALGVHLFSLTRRGYRLARPLELLDHARVQKNVRSEITLEFVDEIASTNSELLARVGQTNAQPPSHFCLAAELQTAGRGRRGRAWQSALGSSLTFSYLWRTEKGAQDLAGLSLAVGLAVAEALRVLGAPAQVKWPNDILLHDKKLGGILIETQGDMLGPTAVVIGVGINIALPDEMKAAIDQAVTDLSEAKNADGDDLSIGRNALFGAVLQALFDALEVFSAHGFVALKDRWRALHALEGRAINVLAANEQYAANVVGVADDGALLIERIGSKRAVEKLLSADVSVRSAA
jgi:BirA family transcriptional regulator, biotin operon repressor / biotin---[acetyl-CoA-carboxylase] ligase